MIQVGPELCRRAILNQKVNDLEIPPAAADQHQYIVGRPRQRTDRGGDSTPVLDKPTYHTSFASAVKSAVSTALRDDVAEGAITTPREFALEQKRLTRELEALLKPLDSGGMPE